MPSVFITTLTKSGSNAVDKLNALTAKADFTKAVRLRNNAVQDQANLLKFALLSFVGAAIAVAALVFYRHFRALVDSFILEMEQQAVKFVDIVHSKRK